MKAKGRKRIPRIVARVIVFALIGGSLAIAAALFGAEVANETVYGIFGQSSLAVDAARAHKAEQFAPELYGTVTTTWDDARKALRRENEVSFLRRNHMVSEFLAANARTLAQEASVRAIVARNGVRKEAATELVLARHQTGVFAERYGGVPMDRVLRRNFSAGEILLKEGENAFNRGDYRLALAHLRQARSQIVSADVGAERYVQACLVNAPKWQAWARETVEWSAAQDAAAIVVDKMAGVCQVYVDGRLRSEFDIELGSQWLGPKRQVGDKATPEGRYHITQKKSGAQTKYYKALVINYPNASDQERFEGAKRRGEISPKARIGGLIEIHGDGGRGANWTQGCVALTNADMDKLFPMVEVGTPVTIVGSSQGRKTLLSMRTGNGKGKKEKVN